MTKQAETRRKLLPPNLFRIGALSLCLLPCAACSKTPARPSPCPEPPALLLLETEAAPRPVPGQNLDLVLHILHLQSRLEACNADKAALRQWRGGLKSD